MYRGLYNIALKSLGAAMKRSPGVRLEHVLEYGQPLPPPVRVPDAQVMGMYESGACGSFARGAGYASHPPDPIALAEP